MPPLNASRASQRRPSEPSPYIPQLLTVAEVGERLNVGERMVRRLVGDGRLPSLRLGGHVRVSLDDLAAFVRAAQQNSRPFN